MKKIILTIDYELFFGNKSGTVRECMIDKTLTLAQILEINESKMTVFWDILHYYRLLELEDIYPELKEERLIIKEQVLDLVKRGHDIQLHLHPHWLDTNYKNKKWIFNYDRFRLDSLSKINDPEDIYSILGCVTKSKKLMEEVVREANPDYKVEAYRAGGYLVEPFSNIHDAFAKNSIFIDSSVSPNTKYTHDIFSYDFSGYPDLTFYNYDLSPKNVSVSGKFTEIPVASIKIPLLMEIYFRLLRKIKYSDLDKERSGEGTYHSFYNTSLLHKIKDILFNRENQMFSTDTNFEERFKYMLSKVPDSGTMILHPKLLNKHNFNLFRHYLSSNKIQFISIMKYINSFKKVA